MAVVARAVLACLRLRLRRRRLGAAVALRRAAPRPRSGGGLAMLHRGVVARRPRVRQRHRRRRRRRRWRRRLRLLLALITGAINFGRRSGDRCGGRRIRNGGSRSSATSCLRLLLRRRRRRPYVNDGDVPDELAAGLAPDDAAELVGGEVAADDHPVVLVLVLRLLDAILVCMRNRSHIKQNKKTTLFTS